MDQLEELKSFLLLAKTAKGAACQALIKQVLDHPGIFVFGELLDMPNVQELASNAAGAQTFELLKLFAYGTWSEYKSSPLASVPLTDAQAIKLKKLSIVSLASQNKMLPYSVLMRELEMQSVRQVEDLLIQCIYGGLIGGRLDQAAGQIELFSCAARDVHMSELDGMREALGAWHSNAQELIGSVTDQLARFKKQAEEDAAMQAGLDEKVEAVKASLRASVESGEHFGASEIDARMDFDGDEKMRKSGRLKARHPTAGSSKHNVTHSR